MSAAPPVDQFSPAREDVVAVADTFVTLMRSFTRAKARMLAAAKHDVEWSSHIVLRCLANDGPMRSSALAGVLRAVRSVDDQPPGCGDGQGRPARTSRRP